jgi:transposase
VWPRGPCGQCKEAEAHLRQSKQKTDQIDAENLARLARLDPKLLYPLKHRGEECQAHMAIIRSRDALVSSRTQLVNHVRGGGQIFRRKVAQVRRPEASTRGPQSTSPRRFCRP